MNLVDQTQNTETVFLSQQNMGIYELKKGSFQASNRESLSKELGNQSSRPILEIFVVCTATTIADQFELRLGMLPVSVGKLIIGKSNASRLSKIEVVIIEFHHNLKI